MKWKHSISILAMTAILAGIGTASAINMMGNVDTVEQILQARKDFFMNGLSYRWVDSPEQVNWDEIGDNEVILTPNAKASADNQTVDMPKVLTEKGEISYADAIDNEIDFSLDGLSYRWADSTDEIDWNTIGDDEVVLVRNQNEGINPDNTQTRIIDPEWPTPSNGTITLQAKDKKEFSGSMHRNTCTKNYYKGSEKYYCCVVNTSDTKYFDVIPREGSWDDAIYSNVSVGYGITAYFTVTADSTRQKIYLQFENHSPVESSFYGYIEGKG